MLSILKNKIYNFINWFLNPIFNLIANKISLLHYIHGDRKRLILGDNIGLVNTVFNTASGNILIEDNVIFGHNCMVLTGTHNFKNGKRMFYSGLPDTPTDGYDIKIGEGSWITSGVIITGGVSIGKHCIVASGAVVTKNFPDHSILAGVPAKIIGSTLDIK